LKVDKSSQFLVFGGTDDESNDYRACMLFKGGRFEVLEKNGRKEFLVERESFV